MSGGTTPFIWDSGIIRAGTVGGAGIRNSAATSSNPTLLPQYPDLTTGVGGASGEVSIVTGSTEAARWDAAQDMTAAGRVLTPYGSAVSPTHGFSATAGLGMYAASASVIRFTIGNAYKASLTTTQLLLAQVTSSTVPKFGFAASPGTGLGYPVANETSIITNSVERQRWSANTAGLPVSTITRDSVGLSDAGEMEGLRLSNTIDAAAGAANQQYSPMLVLKVGRQVEEARLSRCSCQRS